MMRDYFIIIMALSFLSMVLFAYFRNRQAKRNDARRERLWQKQEELIEMLGKGPEATNKGIDEKKDQSYNNDLQ